MREADYDAYDLDDPKHPDWEDLAAERADLERKREKEDALSEADGSRILLAPERTQGFPLSRAESEPVSNRGKRAWVFLGLACFLVGMFILVEQARAHNLPGTEHNRRHAITHAFCKSLTPCPLGAEALEVAYCESGPSLSPRARNGEYLGMFQFGSWARATFGFGFGPWEQARAARRYWQHSGWSGWSCRP